MIDRKRLQRGFAALFAFAAACLVGAGAAAQANDFPNKPINLVIPYQPGSGTDQVGRLLAQGLTAELKVPVVIENKPGGNGFIAARQVASAPPDGYTMILGGSTSHAANPHMFKQLPYDPVKDFTPVSVVFRSYMVLVVNAASPAKSFTDLVNMARKSPGKLTVGIGSASGRVAAEMLRQTAKLDMVNVPYKGNPQGVADLIGGQIDFMFTDPVTALAQVSGGKLRALAVTSKHRLDKFAEVPTVDESGFKGYEVSIWIGLYLPARVPPAVLERISAATSKVLLSNELQEFGNKNLYEIKPTSPEQLAKFQAAETDTLGRVLRAAGVMPE